MAQVITKLSLLLIVSGCRQMPYHPINVGKEIVGTWTVHRGSVKYFIRPDGTCGWSGSYLNTMDGGTLFSQSADKVSMGMEGTYKLDGEKMVVILDRYSGAVGNTMMPKPLNGLGTLRSPNTLQMIWDLGKWKSEVVLDRD